MHFGPASRLLNLPLLLPPTFPNTPPLLLCALGLDFGPFAVLVGYAARPSAFSPPVCCVLFGLDL